MFPANKKKQTRRSYAPSFIPSIVIGVIFLALWMAIAIYNKAWDNHKLNWDIVYDLLSPRHWLTRPPPPPSPKHATFSERVLTFKSPSHLQDMDLLLAPQQRANQHEPALHPTRTLNPIFPFPPPPISLPKTKFLHFLNEILTSPQRTAADVAFGLAGLEIVALGITIFAVVTRRGRNSRAHKSARDAVDMKMYENITE